MEDWQLKPARDLALPNHQRLRSVERENFLLDSALHLLWWPLVWSYLRLAHRLEVRGRDHLPSEPPFILVANHCSHLDALVLAAFLPVRLRDHVFPIAAGDLFFETPIRAVLATSVLNALPMWRRKCGPGSLLVLRQRLVEDPCGYILFPEGTRSRDGTMSAFKPGLGCLVAETPVPVVPCPPPGRLSCSSSAPRTPSIPQDRSDNWRTYGLLRRDKRPPRLGTNRPDDRSRHSAAGGKGVNRNCGASFQLAQALSVGAG